ncbi:FtsX-like permease family protein [Sporanaerobacter acetigenes]|uniref:Putative ABC transport system permease protein n=1 Tax=Sporanaerobacter acetigenes DSM 13106 TaxID=1123281 RepID=A0A1M5WAL3_9FIRM|nr:FtsX-like permease family protein [Sporanaerobacter acetigenes]SHH84619.1 putative ABC transport system permease protein [Sporanaerobacter acetigenes DSM 13106]
MKNTLLKDTFRAIGNTLGRFLAIFAIVALGVGFFAGIKATAPDMKITADKYFDDYNLMDIWLISTKGFDEKDIEAIEKVEEIDEMSLSYSIDVLADDGENIRVLKLLSIPENIEDNNSYMNNINLVKGRYPENSGECLAESGSMTTESLSIGNKIKLYSGTDEDISGNLKKDEYTVVGLVESPLYISFERGTSTIGNGKIESYIMIPEENFKLPVYTDIYLTVKDAKDVFTYSDEYDDVLDPVQKNLKDVGKTREEERYDEILAEANEKLDEGKRELKEGEEKQQTELKKAEEDLSKAKAEIDKGERDLKNKENEFYKNIRDAEKKLNDEEKKLKQGEEEYYKNLKSFNEMKAKTEKELKEAELNQVLSSKTELEKEKQKLILGEQELQNAKKDIDEGKTKLEEERKRLETSKKKALKEFAEARNKLNSAKEEYESGYEEYLNGKKEFDEKLDEARRKIAKGEKELKELEKPKWYVLKRSETRDFIDYGMAADRIDAIAQVFPLFFFVIAVLVCLTTMTRMVDEERGYIGSLKAMGYSNMHIASKYLIYAAIASISGSILGLLIGFKVFPTVIFNSYRIMYIMPPVITEFNIFYALISTAGAVFATTMAALVACYNELRETPALLLRPKSPKMGKRILLERIEFIWSRLKFTQKVTARNLFRYKKRFFMTIVGISGCTALLIAGFGLKDSIVSIAVKQFDEIYKYQMTLELKDGLSKGQTNEVLGFLKEDSKIKDYMLMKEQVVDIGKGDVEKTANLIVPENWDKIDNFIILRNRITGDKISIPEDGVVLTEKMAKLLKVDVGDEIYIKVEEDKKAKVEIAGITENYSFHYIYMSPHLYEKVFEKDVEFQKILAKTTGTDKAFEDKISKEILKYGDVSSINFITGISKSFKDMIGSLNYVVLVLIFSAGALAFVVLYNLTNINISERIREIATIKVLGFYDEEVSKYVYRENAILTIIGTAVGLVLGVFLHKFIILTGETEFIMFGRKIRFVSFVYSAILTIFFSLLVNFVMYFKLKKIDMVESLKSID